MSRDKVLIYVLRRDLRIADNPILHYLATTPWHGFTHLLPIYIFPCHQIEISGFLKDGEQSPYPEARTPVGKFWKCGPHRAKFIAQSVWDLKLNLERLNSGLLLRVGATEEVLDDLIYVLRTQGPNVGAVWMTEDSSYEEIKEQNGICEVCSIHDVEFKMWSDEKYFVDDRDNNFIQDMSGLPDIFTDFRKLQDPLRQRPRPVLPGPEESSLPPMPDIAYIPPQRHPFVAVETLDDLISRLLKPLNNILVNPPGFPTTAFSSHPFQGGETKGVDRLQHIIRTGVVNSYTDTRNRLLGTEFSTKLSAYLALGCITARRIHGELLKLEDGIETAYEQAPGYGKGESNGTASIRYELLWRDYMRLCARRYGSKLYELGGFKKLEGHEMTWKTPVASSARPDQSPTPQRVSVMLRRFFEGTTGMGFVDASQRELFHTGFTSTRARQNVASYLTRMLYIDWRYGAEWYEMLLIDYDAPSNWSNWQYIAGVGKDPRGGSRIFNPVKQSFEYDKRGEYTRTWVPEVRRLGRSENVFQVWTTDPQELARWGLTYNVMVTDPIKRIEFIVNRYSRPSRQRPQGGGQGGQQGGGGGGSSGSGSTNTNSGNNTNNNSGGSSNSNNSSGSGSSNNSGSGSSRGSGSGSTNANSITANNRGSTNRTTNNNSNGSGSSTTGNGYGRSGSGSRNSYGSRNGYGSGSGHGSRNGYGSGSGYGNGRGYGNGSGYGNNRRYPPQQPNRYPNGFQAAPRAPRALAGPYNVQVYYPPYNEGPRIIYPLPLPNTHNGIHRGYSQHSPNPYIPYEPSRSATFYEPPGMSYRHGPIRGSGSGGRMFSGYSAATNRGYGGRGGPYYRGGSAPSGSSISRSSLSPTAPPYQSRRQNGLGETGTGTAAGTATGTATGTALTETGTDTTMTRAGTDTIMAETEIDATMTETAAVAGTETGTETGAETRTGTVGENGIETASETNGAAPGTN